MPFRQSNFMHRILYTMPTWWRYLRTVNGDTESSVSFTIPALVTHLTSNTPAFTVLLMLTQSFLSNFLLGPLFFFFWNDFLFKMLWIELMLIFISADMHLDVSPLARLSEIIFYRIIVHYAYYMIINNIINWKTKIIT